MNMVRIDAIKGLRFGERTPLLDDVMLSLEKQIWAELQHEGRSRDGRNSLWPVMARSRNWFEVCVYGQLYGEEFTPRRPRWR